MRSARTKTILRRCEMLVHRLTSDENTPVQRIAREVGLTINVQEEQTRPWAIVWTARFEPNSEPIAFLVAWAVADELHLIQIATRPDARKRGAARSLMTTLLAHAAERKSRLVLLEVRRSNRPAIRLYREFGFCAMGVRRGYYSDGEDAVEMMLTMDPVTGAVKPGRDEVQLVEA